SEAQVHLGHGGAAQIVDGNRVGATQRIEIHALDAIGIHRDVGHVAGKPQSRAVGRDVDFFVDVGAVELHGVVAGLTFDGVGAVARVPNEGVVAGAQQGDVVAGPAAYQVVSLAAGQHV